MDVLLDHPVPALLLLAGAAVLLVAEFLFRRGVFGLKDKTSGLLANICVFLLVLTGCGMFVFLTVTGAGIELMLPVMLLILLGTLI